MDGFEANEGVIIIAATNRPDVLDPALLRPGRFDRQIVVPNPDVAGREKILKVHMRKVPLAPDVDPKVIARGTPGFSGADLANLVNEAALLAARRNKRLVTQAEFEDAKDKVMMGAERRSMIMTEEEKLATAYHEGGPRPGQHARAEQRSAAQGDDHPARPRAGRHHEPARARPPQLLQAVVRGAHRHHVRRTRRRAARSSARTTSTPAPPATSSRRPSSPARMVTEWGMSEKLGPRALQRQRAGGLPRPRRHAAPEHVRGDGAADRRGGPPHRHGRREEGARDARPPTATSWRRSRRR